MLAPGGKALVLNLSNPIYQTMYLTNGANEVIVQKKIDEILASINSQPPLTGTDKQCLRRTKRSCCVCMFCI